MQTLDTDLCTSRSQYSKHVQCHSFGSPRKRHTHCLHAEYCAEDCRRDSWKHLSLGTLKFNFGVPVANVRACRMRSFPSRAGGVQLAIELVRMRQTLEPARLDIVSSWTHTLSPHCGRSCTVAVICGEPFRAALHRLAPPGTASHRFAPLRTASPRFAPIGMVSHRFALLCDTAFALICAGFLGTHKRKQ